MAFPYFRQGNSTAKFGANDAYVHERMARLASRKHGLRGINWQDRFTWSWLGTLGIYRLTGTVRYPTAPCAAMNDVGEPCAGERHARFDRGPLAERFDSSGASGPGSVARRPPR